MSGMTDLRIFDPTRVRGIVEAKDAQIAELRAQGAALSTCLDVMLRMIPEVCSEHGEEQCTDAEHDAAVEQAALALYGADRAAWPARVVAVCEGRYQ